jgi:hypothetical protein
MAMGDGDRATGPLHRLRQRWLAPSPPLPVDEVSNGPSADLSADDQDERSESDGMPGDRS